MSDCGPGGHSPEVWTPASRCTRRGCGHRVGAPCGKVPIATRRLPKRYWLFEVAARYVATHPVTELEPRS